MAKNDKVESELNRYTVRFDTKLCTIQNGDRFLKYNFRSKILLFVRFLRKLGEGSQPLYLDRM